MDRRAWKKTQMMEKCILDREVIPIETPWRSERPENVCAGVAMTHLDLSSLKIYV